MNRSQLLKGYYHAGMATIAGSMVYLFSKAALEDISLAQFGVWWFFFAIIWNLIYSIALHEVPSYRQIDRKSFRALVFLGFIEIIATSCFFISIHVSDNPSLPSFVRNMEYVFVALLGFTVLKEKFNHWILVGVVLTLTGVIIISYNQSLSFYSLYAGATGIMVVATIFYTVRTITAKRFITKVSPTILALNRALFLMLFSLTILLSNGESILISRQVFIIILIGSFLGPFLTSLNQFSALVFFEASFTAILQSTTGLFVLLGAWIYFGNLPFWYQILGGVITIAGVVVLTHGKNMTKK